MTFCRVMAVTDLFSPLLATRGVVILDGALATELERRGADLRDPLWSARLLIERPESIRAVHDAYVTAGADVSITATYQASFEGFARRGIDPAGATVLLQRAVDLAMASRDAFWADPVNRENRGRPLVAASVGPYGAFLNDGSEYRGEYSLDEDALVAWHQPRFDVLAQSGADLLACETIPCASEARALVRCLEAYPERRAWISFSARDDTCISSGEAFAPIAAEIGSHPQVVAVGINCTAPQHVAPLVRAARAVTSARIVVYPNSGESWDAVAKCWVDTPCAESLLDGARAWHDAGATLIGGCCRTTPDDIRAVAEWALTVHRHE
jgi:homocysteine S-methyltransferase